MLDLKGFIKKGLLDAAGKLADYEVTFIAAYWFDKRVLNEADITDIATAINAAEIADDFHNHNDIPTYYYYDFSLGDPPDEAISK